MKRLALAFALTLVLIGLAAAPAVAQETTQITCVSDDGSISEDIKFFKSDDVTFAVFVRRLLTDLTPGITDDTLEFIFDEEVEAPKGVFTIRTSYWINRNSGRYTARISFEGVNSPAGPVHHGSCILTKQKF